jgi:hypothetical protein
VDEDEETHAKRFIQPWMSMTVEEPEDDSKILSHECLSWMKRVREGEGKHK